MSIEAAKAFSDKVDNDKALHSKVNEVTSGSAEDSLAQVIEIASDAGFQFTAEELQAATSELGDQELDRAAGGTNSRAVVFGKLFWSNQSPRDR